MEHQNKIAATGDDINNHNHAGVRLMRNSAKRQSINKKHDEKNVEYIFMNEWNEIFGVFRSLSQS